MGSLISAAIRFEADAATVGQIRALLNQRGLQKVVFRTGDLRRLQMTRGGAPPEPEADLGPRLFTLTIQSEENLITAGRALMEAGVRAWIAVSSPEGPTTMEITEFLRLRGRL